MEAAEKRLEYLLGSSPAIIYCCNIEPGQKPADGYPPSFVSSNIKNLIGYGPEECLDNPKWWSENIHPDDVQEAIWNLSRIFEKGRVVHEYRFRHKDGGYKWVRDELILCRDPEGNPVEFVGSWVDITERKKAEAALAWSEESARGLLNATTDIALLAEADGTILALNSVAVSRLGKDTRELVGKKIYDLFPKPVSDMGKEMAAEVIRTKKAMNNKVERDGIYWDTSVYPIIDEHGNVARLAIYARDVTDLIIGEANKLKMEKRLQQAQKMETVGTLSGGIAHDVNNILQIITTYASLLQDCLSKTHEGQKSVSSILSAGKRAAALVDQLLAFSRTGSVAPTPFLFRTVVEEAIDLLRKNLPAGIEMEVDIPPDDGCVMGEPDQIHRVLINLANNSIAAMSERGGILHVDVEPVELKEKLLTEMGSLLPGSYFRLSVSDTGRGMSQEIQSRIFEPFFSTRDVGRGTGLGLSVVHGVVTAHQGAVTVRSELNQGSTFSVYLPRSNQIAEIKKDNPLAVSSRSSILFVDDDPEQVRLGTLILEKTGYLATGANGGQEALEVLERSPERFDVLIADQNMPGVTGIDLLRRAATVAPDLKTIIATGRAEASIMLKIKDNSAAAILPKPFTPEELKLAIERALA